MNWYNNKLAQLKPIVMWHATIPRFAEQILEDGFIKSSSILEKETGNNYSGWNFPIEGQNYGDGIYLATNRDLAIYYTFIRLEKEWESIEDYDDLFLEEEIGFIALFKVYILDKSKLISIKEKYVSDRKDELMFLENIPKIRNNTAWFEGPEWIDKTKELEQYRQKIEDINKQFIELKK